MHWLSCLYWDLPERGVGGTNCLLVAKNRISPQRESSHDRLLHLSYANESYANEDRPEAMAAGKSTLHFSNLKAIQIS